jgi:SAM-dependent methyltransferase
MSSSPTLTESAPPAPHSLHRSATGVHPSPTFRDPAGSLHLEDDLAVRTIHPAAREAVLNFVSSPFYLSLVDRGLIVASTIDDTWLGPSGEPGLRLLHPRIPVPTYPWEWTPSQWLAAADLTLTLCEEALDHGWILKDATPLNILFVGPRPILVDVLSFEAWPHVATPANPTPAPQIWLAYGQYMRTFLLPLLMNRMLSWPLALSLFKRDGYEPADLYNALSWPQRLSRAALWPVTLPAILERRGNPDAPAPSPRPVTDPGLALHTLKRTLAGLRRMTHRAMPAVAASDWSDYKSTLTHYTADQSSDKHSWVAQVIAETRPSTPSSQQAWRVLDIGANTGEFSVLAAHSGASVVALERDAAAADRLFRLTRDQALAVQTIHADLSRPTPSAGWLNNETSSLLHRLEARPNSGFDLVLMLAVIHHLLLMEQIPLPSIVQLCHRLTRRHLVIEWVPPSDPMYISLMRGRTDLYGNLSESDLLFATTGLFRSLHRHPLANGRVLYLFEKI